MRTNEQQTAFDKGYTATKAELRVMRFSAVRDKFNEDNPRTVEPKTLEAYHYAKGQMATLLEGLR